MGQALGQGRFDFEPRHEIHQIHPLIGCQTHLGHLVTKQRDAIEEFLVAFAGLDHQTIRDFHFILWP